MISTDRPFDFTIQFEKHLNDNVKTYDIFAYLSQELDSKENGKILLDFTNVQFVSANLFAVLGAILDVYSLKKNHQIYVKGMSDKIKSLIARNGFHRYFTIQSEIDHLHNCIPYRVFGAETQNLAEFEKYLLLKLFSHRAIPKMAENYKDRIIDNFLEMFNNVIDHAQSESVYVCGQVFPKSSMLLFSIVDIGLTITNKVEDYFTQLHQPCPDNCIEWAIQAGHSTKIHSPGGIGISELNQFLSYNQGSLFIISGNEFYKKSSKGEKYIPMEYCFPGTIVTIGVNLSDENWYLYDNENEEVIVF